MKIIEKIDMVSDELEDPSPLAKLGVRQNQKEKVTYATNKELISQEIE